jgi:concanavalin A-like lectin/glucanase superfamily protein
MGHIEKGDVRSRAGVIASVCGLLALVVSSVACGGAGAKENKFSAETYDEYTEPLTNAVIGTPSGVITVGPDGGSSSSSGGGTTGGGGPVPPLTATDGGVVGTFDGGPVEGGPGDGGQSGGFGQWHFDDCSGNSHFLVDSSGGGANAQQALKADCVPGISGLGVQIRSAKDVIQVPDEPQFTVGSNIAVAAWVHPNTVSGNQPIVIKRLNNRTAFSLGIHNGNVEMSVVLTTGTTVISRAPITAGVWSHVAGMFDGTFVFLFIDGKQFGQVFGAGTVQDVFAPIRIGATTQSQFLDGIVDEVFVSTQVISSDTLTALACISRPTTLAVNPPTSGPVPFDTTFHYDVSVNDNNIGFCPGTSYDLFVNSSDPGITTNVDQPSFVQGVQPGSSVTFGIEVSGSDFAEVGVHQIPFEVEGFNSSGFSNFEFLTGQLSFELAQPTGCFVSTSRELMILDTSVVDDPVRTFGVAAGGGFADGGPVGEGGVVEFDASVGVASGGGDPVPAPAVSAGNSLDGGGAIDASGSPSLGVWSFGHLMREMAPTPDQAPAMVLNLFQNWLTDQPINGFTVAARPAMQQVLLDIWPRTPDGQLDLDQAPLRLQAIVDRIDLRNLSAGSAGEGRFVFGVDDQNGSPQQFTVILEYNLPAQTQQDVSNWAAAWHGLQSHPFPSEDYNAALETITRRFTSRGAAAGGVNGNALATLRTNEIVLSSNGRWELREFVLSPTTGFLQETTVKETPDLGFNGSQTFADFVNENAAAIIAEVPGATGVVPAQFEGSPFLAGSVFNDLVTWSGPGIANDDARFHASLNTCNGCHGPEVNTTFLQITPRFPGNPATLSPFLTGTSVVDQAGQQRTVNDLGRRRSDLTSLVCPPSDAGPPVAQDAAPPVAPDTGAP